MRGLRTEILEEAACVLMSRSDALHRVERHHADREGVHVLHAAPLQALEDLVRAPQGAPDDEVADCVGAHEKERLFGRDR